MSNKKILVVDDMASTRTNLRNMIAEADMGYVTEAGDGEKALQFLIEAHNKNKPFNLIISDWHMPKLNGLELLKALRKNETFQSLPFIMVTTESEKDSILEAINEGANGFLLKPYKQKELVDKIKSTIK